MPSYEDRKDLIRRLVLDRFNALYRSDERTKPMMAEMGKAMLRDLPADYDAAACEATLEVVADQIISAHRYATWPNVGEVAKVLRQVVRDRAPVAAQVGRSAPGGDAAPERHWDDWTLEGARQRVEMVQRELDLPGLDPFRQKILLNLLSIARKAEAKCYQTQEKRDG